VTFGSEMKRIYNQLWLMSALGASQRDATRRWSTQSELISRVLWTQINSKLSLSQSIVYVRCASLDWRSWLHNRNARGWTTKFICSPWIATCGKPTMGYKFMWKTLRLSLIESETDANRRHPHLASLSLISQSICRSVHFWLTIASSKSRRTAPAMWIAARIQSDTKAP